LLSEQHQSNESLHCSFYSEDRSPIYRGHPPDAAGRYADDSERGGSVYRDDGVEGGGGLVADALVGALGRRAGCGGTLTFDRKAGRIEGFLWCDERFALRTNAHSCDETA
jgi:hypothetical protein